MGIACRATRHQWGHPAISIDPAILGEAATQALRPPLEIAQRGLDQRRRLAEAGDPLATETLETEPEGSICQLRVMPPLRPGFFCASDS